MPEEKKKEDIFLSTKITFLDKFLSTAGIAAQLAIWQGVNNDFVSFVGNTSMVFLGSIITKKINPEYSLKISSFILLGGAVLEMSIIPEQMNNSLLKVGATILTSSLIYAGLLGFCSVALSKGLTILGNKK